MVGSKLILKDKFENRTLNYTFFELELYSDKENPDKIKKAVFGTRFERLFYRIIKDEEDINLIFSVFNNIIPMFTVDEIYNKSFEQILSLNPID